MSWKPIETAPKDKRLLVWTGKEMYCAHWAKNPYTDDEAWVIAEWGERDQALVKPTHWMELPEAPRLEFFGYPAPIPQCDEGCMYHCTEGGAHPPICNQ
jgi:hypothetical protein